MEHRVGNDKFLTTTFFTKAFTSLIQNLLSNIFKTARRVGQNKENKFPMTSSMRLYSNDVSWETTNQRARKIHHIVTYIWLSISYFIYNQLSLTRTPLSPVLSVRRS